MLALGTNDSANVYVYPGTDMLERIHRMMAATGGDPVMWVNVKSLVSSGPYAAQNMREWDKALLEACADYPTMRVFDWASVVKDSWFIGDGIHFTTPGYRPRSRLIADALDEAFPSAGGSPDCIVR